MFRAQIQSGRQGPVLKMEGKLVREWAEQARSLVDNGAVPKEIIVDLAEISYVDCTGEQLLTWLAARGAKFLAGNVYIANVCHRLQLPPVVRERSRSERRSRSSSEKAISTT